MDTRTFLLNKLIETQLELNNLRSERRELVGALDDATQDKAETVSIAQKWADELYKARQELDATRRELAVARDSVMLLEDKLAAEKQKLNPLGVQAVVQVKTRLANGSVVLHTIQAVESVHGHTTIWMQS